MNRRLNERYLINTGRQVADRGDWEDGLNPQNIQALEMLKKSEKKRVTSR